MMKMATGDGSPSGRVPEQGPDWFFVATEAYDTITPDLGSVPKVSGYIRGVGGGTPDIFCSPKFLGYMDIYMRKKSVKGAMRDPRGGGAPRG